MAEANELERASALILTVYAESEMKDLGVAKVQILKYRDSRNEDDPTEVNIDLQYYLFGDLSEGTTSISSEISPETENILEHLDSNDLNGDDEIMAEFDEFLNSSNKGGL